MCASPWIGPTGRANSRSRNCLFRSEQRAVRNSRSRGVTPCALARRGSDVLSGSKLASSHGQLSSP